MTNSEPIPRSNLLDRFLFIRRFVLFSRAGWVANGYLILLCAAELLVAFDKPQFGLLLHSMILIALLVQSSLVYRPHQRRFLLVLSLTPLIRILSLIIPFTLFPVIYQYAIVGIPLFIAAFLIARSAGISGYSAGLSISSVPFQLLISFSGIFLGFVEYVILKPASIESALTIQQIWLPALILLVFTGFLEELIFRGLMQSAAVPYLERYGIPYVALVFAVMHIGYRSILDLIFVFGVALFFGVVVKRSGSILGVTL
ncbi:MAG: CPBP family intramembrane glutamic endopeptidase, partial [Anaerolineaceae bacterium]